MKFPALLAALCLLVPPGLRAETPPLASGNPGTLTELTLSNQSVSRWAGENAVVGTLAVTNPGSGTFTYSFAFTSEGSDNSAFSISGNLLLAKNPINFIAGTYLARVKAADGSGRSFTRAFLIDVLAGDGGPLKVTAVAAGSGHTLFTKEDGSLWSMGYNLHGQLGDGTTLPRAVPLKIVPGGVRAISAGLVVSFFIKNDNTLWAMGANNGLYGIGTAADQHVPTQIATNVSQVTAGSSRALYVKTDGTLWETRNFAHSSLPGESRMARQIASGVVSATAGPNHCFFVKSDSSLWGYGTNLAGQIGDGSTGWIDTPVKVGDGYQAAGCGSTHSAFLKENGTLWSTGRNSSGQLGDGTISFTDRLLPAPIPGVTDAIAVAAGGESTVFLRADKTLWGLGKNTWRQLGDGDDGLARPSPVLTATHVVQVSTSELRTLFIKDDGTLWGVGNNEDGALGDGSTQVRSTPVLIVGPPISSDASITNLRPSLGFIDPAVVPTTTAYSSFVPHGTTSISLAVDTTDPLALVRINGARVANGATSAPIPIGGGWNQVSILVTAQSGATRAYQYHVYPSNSPGAAPVITSAGTASGAVGTPFSFTVRANLPGYFSLISGPLPPGLSFDISTGVVSGTPLCAGFFGTEFAAYGQTGSGKSALGITITQPGQLTQAISFPVIADRPVSSPPFTLAASVPSGLPVSFSLISGPATLNGNTVTLTGNPGPVVIRASQAGNASYAAAPPVDRSFMVTTTTNIVPVVTSSTSVTGDAGQAFSHTFTASNGPITFSLHSGSLPPGLALNPATGVLAGSVVTPGTYSFIMKATNASGSATFTQTLTFNSAPTQFAPAALAAGMQISFDGVVVDSLEGEYGESKTVRVTSATSFQGGTYTYSKTGANTATLSYELNDSGEVENGTIQVVFTSATGGTYNSSGSYQGSWDGEEYFGDFTGEGTFDFVGPVTPSIVTPGLLPASTAGTSYSQALSASDGTPPYKWSLASGKLPVGLKVNSAGSITGTTKTGGLFSFLLRVTDKNKRVTTKAFSLVVNAPPLIATRTPLAAGTAGTAYGLNLVATNGLEPYTWSIAAGTLPPGLSLSGSGTISGTPIEQSAASFTVQVAGSNGLSASQTMALTTNAPPLISTPDTLPNGTTGSPYSQSLTASGGAPAYAWSISSGKLPAGLKLAKTGVIAGKPTAAGTTTFTVKITGKNKLFSTRTFTLAVNPAAAAARLAMTGVADDDEADPDADGIPNLLEELLGGDPRSNSRHLLPTVSVDGRDLIFTYRRKLAAAPIIQIIEHSPDLSSSWTPAVHGESGVTISLIVLDATTEQVVTTIPSAAGSRFVRLKATR